MRGYLYTGLLMLLVGCVEVMEPFEVKLNGEELVQREVEDLFSQQKEGYYYVHFDTVTSVLFLRYDAAVTSDEKIYDELVSRSWVVDSNSTSEVLLENPEMQSKLADSTEFIDSPVIFTEPIVIDSSQIEVVLEPVIDSLD
jgi:hypothetical protein